MSLLNCLNKTFLFGLHSPTVLKLYSLAQDHTVYLHPNLERVPFGHTVLQEPYLSIIGSSMWTFSFLVLIFFSGKCS